MRAAIDPDAFLSEVFKLRDELDDLGEVVSNEHLTAIILEALPNNQQFKNKRLEIGPCLCLEEITNTVKTIFISHSKRSSVPKRSEECKGCDSDCEQTINGQK